MSTILIPNYSFLVEINQFSGCPICLRLGSMEEFCDWEATIMSYTKGCEFLSRFPIIDELGYGSFGMVFHVQDLESKRHFAVKVIMQVGCSKSEWNEMEIMTENEHINLMRDDYVVRTKEKCTCSCHS